MNIYGKIEPTEFQGKLDQETMDLILFDPSEVYNRIKIDKYKRKQQLSMYELFPTIEPGVCACGCGEALSGRATRWAKTSHSDFPVMIMKIINGDGEFIRRVLMCYLKYECCKCHCLPYERSKQTVKTWYDGKNYTEYWSSPGIQVDHILAVKNGGGGCWLGNYQFICHVCHREKTTIDNKIRNIPTALPLSSLFS